MFRLLPITFVFIGSITFAAVPIEVPSYSLCEEAFYDNIGITTSYLRTRYDQIAANSEALPHIEFYSEREQRTYRIRKPVRTPEVVRNQVGQQQYWICLKISEQ